MFPVRRVHLGFKVQLLGGTFLVRYYYTYYGIAQDAWKHIDILFLCELIRIFKYGKREQITTVILAT